MFFLHAPALKLCNTTRLMENAIYHFPYCSPLFCELHFLCSFNDKSYKFFQHLAALFVVFFFSHEIVRAFDVRMCDRHFFAPFDVFLDQMWTSV